jgi:hypothetical protein
MKRKKAGNMLHGDNPRTIRTIERRSSFLEALKATCNITRACEAARIGRSAVYSWRKEDPSFSDDWREALEIAGDALQDEAVRRAVEGVDRPVFQGGQLVGVVREYSDTLLVLLLKGAKPERYRDRQEVRHDGQVDIAGVVLTDQQRAQRITEILERASKRITNETQS